MSTERSRYKGRSPSHKPTQVIESEKVRARRAKQKLLEQIEEELDSEILEWENEGGR